MEENLEYYELIKSERFLRVEEYRIWLFSKEKKVY